ncbi:M23 family peptidase [Geodermatophilus sp. TF02-6]|uniref:M23 family metallopeptidase n=1 Tax=Geodermatophilus sp. TF02-6 TaxID=2250575 RepID=UPI000DE90535|nr:M23 family metallopeptidase [Geodermatophilus sp. TF02-6]RBY74545.1 M23 family peptidase [Geodermatophilus sp. TF02-6]
MPTASYPTTPVAADSWTEEGATPVGRLPRLRPGRHRRLHRALAIGACSLVFACVGQSVAQAEAPWGPGRDRSGYAEAPPPAPAPAPATSVSTGEYAHPCPACRLTQGYSSGAHNGIDLAASIGTPVYAAAAGTVTAAGPRDPGGFGQAVYVNNDDGTIAWYGHIDTWVVNVGDHVAAGQQIATVGNRGNANGSHLHFEIHAPGAIDPASWLRQRGVNI